MTRNDILANRAKFQAVIDKHKASSPDCDIDLTGLTLIDKALAKWREGKPHVVLRNYNRLLKHYLEEAFVWPDSAHEFNAACLKVHTGFSHDQAIRFARNSLKTVNGHGPNKPSQSVSKHDRILEEILSI